MNFDKIKQIKLISGEVIIAYVVNEKCEKVILQYPQEIIQNIMESVESVEEYNNDFSDKNYYELIDWNVCSSDLEFEIEKNKIMIMSNVKDFVKKIYFSKYLMQMMEIMKEFGENAVFDDKSGDFDWNWRNPSSN